MPIGINNITTVTYTNITDVVNVTSMPEFLIKVNWIIYNGIFWFVMLLLLWYILYVAANKVRDQPLNNAMYAGAAVSILSFILRAINMIINGAVKGLLTDHQMWLFPLVTVILAMIIWAIKD